MTSRERTEDNGVSLSILLPLNEATAQIFDELDDP